MCIAATINKTFHLKINDLHFYKFGAFNLYPPTKCVIQLQKLIHWFGMATEPPMSDVIPEYFLSRGLNHFSPSQASLPLDQWVFKYLHYTQDDSKK